MFDAAALGEQLLICASDGPLDNADWLSVSQGMYVSIELSRLALELAQTCCSRRLSMDFADCSVARQQAATDLADEAC